MNQFFHETLLPCRQCGGTIETCHHSYANRRKFEDANPEVEDDDIDTSGYPISRTNPFGERD